MTPKEFLCIQKQQQSIINEAEWTIAAARVEAEKCKAPKHLRKAKPSDLKPGAILWYKQPKAFGPNYWTIVARASNLRSYKADDGNFYYLDDGAFIEE